MRTVHKFHPPSSPEPRAIGVSWIRVGDSWFGGVKLGPEVKEEMEKRRLNRDDNLGITWYRWSPELAKALGVER